MNQSAQRYTQLSGSDKAATLLMALPDEASADVLRRLPQDKVERVTMKMLRGNSVEPETSEEIFREACDLALGHEHLMAGGPDYARALLGQALGAERAEEIVERLLATMREQPFRYLSSVEPAQIATFLQSEHPQTIALILSYLSIYQTADVLSMLPERLQAQVSARLANMDTISPAVVAQVEAALKKKLSSVLESDHSKTGGLEYLVRVLMQTDRGTERAILEQLDESAPDLATEVKKRMFVFENLTQLDDRSIQRVLRDVDGRDLVLALRGATETVRNHVFRNMSQRAAETVRDELEASPPVRIKMVEEAQQKVVAVVRRLEDEEEIVVARGGNDVMV